MIPDNDLSEAAESDGGSRYEDIAEAVCTRLARNQRIRRNLPGDGRLRIDRQLPFLCVYRSPPDRVDTGTVELVTTEAAYLFTPGNRRYLDGVAGLCQQITTTMQQHFGTFLLLEIWANPTRNNSLNFEIVSPDSDSIPSTIRAFESALSEITVNHQQARVTARAADHVAPPGLEPLTAVCPKSGSAGCCVLGLGVEPVYQDPSNGTLYPLVLHSLRHQLAVAIRKMVAQFTGTATNVATESSHLDPASYQSLGPSSLVKAARLIDQQLCEVSESFDFLLQVTPTNAENAYEHFRESGFNEIPRLTYRPLPYRPSLLKRRLFDIEIERIEDPTLAHLFWEKQEEIDRKLTALRDLDTPDFLYSSLQLYGTASDALLTLSRDLLDRITESSPDSNSESSNRVRSKEFIARAHDEFDYYHTKMNEFNATAQISDEIAAGVMVSHDQLLVAETLDMPSERVEAILHHEIGTHLLTYFNGRCQPFRQLYAGLSGYEELQEGLAVLSEFLVGGLTGNRVRTLAGRVIAVSSVTEGQTFTETFELLHETFGFPEKRAFTIALRVHRGGGLTKDVIYLRGLKELLEYLATGRDLEPLYVGKIGLHHVPYIQEMRRRKIIEPPRSLPRFLDDDAIRRRLDACREMSVLSILESDL